MGQGFPLTAPLDGLWGFDYTHELGDAQHPQVPHDLRFEAEMPVPGWWDDSTDLLKRASFWSTARFNPNYRHIDYPMGTAPPDPSTPFLFGVGWYRKRFEGPSAGTVTLHVGGVRMEAWIWLNGSFVTHHLGHSTPFVVTLDDWIRPGETNELIIAVSNTRGDRSGSVVRGYQDRSGGIYRSVNLKVAGRARIADCHVYPRESNTKLRWRIELAGRLRTGDTLDWAVRDPVSNLVVGSGTYPVSKKTVTWDSETFGLREWSDRQPNLYRIELKLLDGQTVMDELTQMLGLRSLTRDGSRLRLNGRHVMLRGTTDLAYFPLTCTPPPDVASYRAMIRELKRIGFNWIRCHTWVPSEEYMQAADELGMMLQVEPPVARQWVCNDEHVMLTPTGTITEDEWVDVMRCCRKHPSVVIYCCGNEEVLDDAKIEVLARRAEMLREHVPDALFSPQEYLRGVESEYMPGELGNDAADKPFRHNPRRLDRVREYSDVFGSFAMGYLSYISSRGDWRVLDEWMSVYRRPILSHEIGILGHYLSLDLEHRYEGSRTGTELFASIRRNLEAAGLLDRAALYYKNSCAWARSLRKHCTENARLCRNLAGYDYLSAIDLHCNRSGYTSGIMNEFYELQAGESAGDVLKYNGESVILLDHRNQRNLTVGSSVSFGVMASLFGESELRDGALSWHLADRNGHVILRGESRLGTVPVGLVEQVGCVEFEVPDTGGPSRLTLSARLSGGEYELTNQWDFWVFAIATTAEANRSDEQDQVRIVSDLDEAHLEFLDGGGRVVLLGAGPFPTLPTTFQIGTPGRASGNLATVIADHALLAGFPHDGYCDWQFARMLEGGSAVVFDDISLPFDPIVEVVSSYKMIHKQACMFEVGVGRGKLLVCTLLLDPADPAGRCMLDSITDYTHGPDFKPRASVSSETIAALLAGRRNSAHDRSPQRRKRR